MKKISFTLLSLLFAVSIAQAQNADKTFYFTKGFSPESGKDGPTFSASFKVTLSNTDGQLCVKIIENSVRINSFTEYTHKGKNYFAVGGADRINGDVHVNIGELFKYEDINKSNAKVELCLVFNGKSVKCSNGDLSGFSCAILIDDVKNVGIRRTEGIIRYVVEEDWNKLNVVANYDGVANSPMYALGNAIEKRYEERDKSANKYNRQPEQKPQQQNSSSSSGTSTSSQRQNQPSQSAVNTGNSPANGSTTPVYDASGTTYRVTDKATGKELYFDSEEKQQAYIRNYEAQRQIQTTAQKQADAQQRLDNLRKQQAAQQQAVDNILSGGSEVANALTEKDPDTRHKGIMMGTAAIGGTVLGNAGVSSVGGVIGGTLGTAGVGIGLSILSDKLFGGNKEAEQQALLEQQRLEEERRQAELARAQMFETRYTLFADYAEGAMPKDKEQILQAWFFAYRMSDGDLQNETMRIAVTNIFPLAKYNDGTFPLRRNIEKEISALDSGNGKIIFAGFYYSEREAQKAQADFVSRAQMSGVTLENLTYKGKKAATDNNSSGNDDLWGTGNSKKETKKANTSNDDFWND